MEHIDISKIQGFIPMNEKLWPEFRQKIYTYLKGTLSAVMTEDDLNIIIYIMAMLFGDLYMRAKVLPWQINVDRCPDEHLEALSSLIGYKWNKGLTADQQRESIKLFCLIRRWRGTNFGLSNLIRVFGQDITSFYSSSDLRGVEIIEYASGGPETKEPNMFPGDIKIRIPELSTILRDSIFDTKLAGTRLIFSYYIFMGVYHMSIYPDFYYKIKEWVTLLTSNYDPSIDTYGSRFLETTIYSTLTDQLTHAVTNGAPIAGVQILLYYKDKWEDGFVFNTPGLTNYRGFIEANPIVNPEDIIYA